jgi:hypothetical protein
MQNQDNKNIPRPSLQDGIIERLKGLSRLSPADKKVFVINLGKLAARIDEAKPLNGAKQIVEHSNQDGIWEKRKRYFRLPGEDTPSNGADGEYASNPAAFISLAEAAGELLCKSTRPESIERERRAAIKALVTGSSHMPTYVPSNSADISAKALLDDYAQALSEAIETRTKITELWKVLETTDIGVDGFTKGYADYEDFEAEQSPYGEAAIFPPLLFDSVYNKSLTSGQFFVDDCQFSKGGYSGGWPYPEVQLGYVATTHKIQMFCISEDQRTLFNADDKTIASALKSLGFQLDLDVMPEYELDETYSGAGWKQVTASIISKVFISAIRGDTGGVKIVIGTNPLMSDQAINPDIYLVATDGRGEKATPRMTLSMAMYNLAEKEKQLIDSGFKKSQIMVHDLPNSSHNSEYTEGDDDDYDDRVSFEFIYNDFFDRNKDHQLLPVAILPEWWIQCGGDNWLDYKDYIKFRENVESRSWTEGEFQAQMLLGAEDIRFYPTNLEADPIAGVLRSGSVGASLLSNLNAKSDANSITNLLIEKAALTAEAGLKFYEAMLEDHRSAIRKI